MEHERENAQPLDIADEETHEPVVSEAEDPRNGMAHASEARDDALMTAMQHLTAEMQVLRKDFDTKIKYDESKERQIDSLHKELQAYRAGLHAKILRPVVFDLISMHDDLSRLIESMENTEGMISIVQVLKNLASFQISIEETLQRNGIESYSVEGEHFVSGKQRVLQTIETAEPALDRQIARRVRKGFEDDDKVLRPELVMTYRAVSLG